MPFIIQGKANLKSILIVVILIVIVYGGILVYQLQLQPGRKEEGCERSCKATFISWCENCRSRNWPTEKERWNTLSHWFVTCMKYCFDITLPETNYCFDKQDLCKDFDVTKFEGVEDETVDWQTYKWQTYKNEKYRFKIEYPEEWKIEVEEVKASVLFTDTTKTDTLHPKGLTAFIINISEVKFHSIYEWFEKEFQDRPEEWVPAYSELLIDETQALKFFDPVSMGGCDESIVLLKNKRFYKLDRAGSTCEYPDEIFDKLISTFKFLE